MSRPSNIVKVCVVGVAGRMGREVAKALANDPTLEMVSAVDREHAGENLRDLIGSSAPNLVIQDKLGAALDSCETHVLVDFTHPSSATGNALSALKRQIAPVIGTSGISPENTREIAEAVRESETPTMIVPNFAIGAVLMMKFAKLAARWMPEAEIIELHHNGKADAPSGTAIMTANQIAAGRLESPERRRDLIHVEGVRGGRVKDVPVHSVRLRGLVAHQEVIFGGNGETLTLRHDSLDRAGFMDGVRLCCREIWNQQGLVIGMEGLLD